MGGRKKLPSKVNEVEDCRSQDCALLETLDIFEVEERFGLKILNSFERKNDRTQRAAHGTGKQWLSIGINGLRFEKARVLLV
jgi:hypothetical protein